MHHASVTVVLNFQMSTSEWELRKVNVDDMKAIFAWKLSY